MSSPISVRSFCFRSPRVAGLALAAALTGSALLAQTRPAGDDPNASRRRGGDEANGGGRRGGGQEDTNAGGRRGGSPQDMQARMMTALRERFGVTDDEEWTLISGRIQKVSELRRGAAGGGGALMGGFRGGSPGGGGDTGNRGGTRGGRGGGSPEVESLQAAINDKLPDAEIKARLTRLRESRKSTEENLQKAQEELRAVLTVRQEATAVLFGLLP